MLVLVIFVIVLVVVFDALFFAVVVSMVISMVSSMMFSTLFSTMNFVSLLDEPLISKYQIRFLRAPLHCHLPVGFAGMHLSR